MYSLTQSRASFLVNELGEIQEAAQETKMILEDQLNQVRSMIIYFNSVFQRI
jgi:hypothetical protein